MKPSDEDPKLGDVPSEVMVLAAGFIRGLLERADIAWDPIERLILANAAAALAEAGQRLYNEPEGLGDLVCQYLAVDGSQGLLDAKAAILVRTQIVALVGQARVAEAGYKAAAALNTQLKNK